MIVSQQHVVASKAAVDAQLQAWRERWPSMGVLVLLPEAEKEAVPVFQALCQQQNIPLTGAIFPALLSDAGFLTEGAWLICFERMPAHFLLPDLETLGPSEIAAAVAASPGLPGIEGERPTLFLVFDGMLANISSIMHEIFGRLGARVRYAGVCAGSETFQPMPCLFDAQQCHGGGVLGFMLDEGAGGVVVRHAYPTSQALMRATSGAGNRIDQIDNRPAFETYRQVIQQEYGVALTKENFYDYAVHFPFGLITALDVLVRIPVALNDDGSLFCVGEVPPQSMLRLLKAPPATNSACVAGIAEALGADKGQSAGRPLLTFYCAGRRMHLGDEAASEVTQLAAATGASAILGALSLGEIDQLADFGIPRFHNAALVCLSLARAVNPSNVS